MTASPDPRRSRPRARGLALLIPILALALPATAQWNNRYPRLAGYSHHVYVEGYEMPLVSRGPVDAVASPVDDRIAFAARGWLWIREGGTATRLTDAAAFDSRPSWSPDGNRIAFVRDDTLDAAIYEVEVASGAERLLVDTPQLDLDPDYADDGATLLYSSAANGDLDLFRLDLDTGESSTLTSERGLELRPQSRGGRLSYLAKTRGGGDQVRVRDGESERIVWRGPIASQLRPALAPDGNALAFGIPTPDGWRLELVDPAAPEATIALTATGRLPITPSWSPAGDAVLFSEADGDGTFRLYRVGRDGGPARELVIERWEWGVPIGRVRVRTRLAGGHGYAPARLEVRTGDDRAQVPERGHVRLEGQNGRLFAYSSGDLEYELPAGPARVLAVQGLATPAVEVELEVVAGQTTVVEPRLQPLWSAEREGWAAGDHHFHLNYGGPYRLERDDLLPMAAAEGLQVLTPLTANLHTRFEDREWWGRDRPQRPSVIFAQEIRSHFLGHVALLGHDEMYWPWIWGPGYPIHGADDRPNRAPLEHARAQGGIGYYVHPVAVADPFDEGNLGAIPVGIVPDALAGVLDALEVGCLWSSDIGTARLWYRFLNLGIPVAPSAGTDVMTDFFRTMAVGATRVYVDTDGRDDFATYLEGLRAGRAFVTSGPWLGFEVDGIGPGEVVESGDIDLAIDLRSAVPVERVEVLVNGAVVWTEAGLEAPGARRLTGRLELPEGGWVAARALGPAADWPAMSADVFAHTGAVWIGARGSTEPTARAAAAAELLAVLEVAWTRVREAYGTAPIPELTAHFEGARMRLRELAGS